MVVAKKGNIKKKFTRIAWDNLGENKNGWVEVSATAVDNTAKEKNPPPTGEVKKKEEPVVVDNTAGSDNKTEPVVDNTAKETPEVESVFTDMVKAGLTRQKIKDYLDSKELPYKAADSLDVLASLLSTLFNGDVEKLKTEFSLA